MSLTTLIIGILGSTGGIGAIVALFRLSGDRESQSVSTMQSVIDELKAQVVRQAHELQEVRAQLSELAPQSIKAKEIIDTVPAMVYEAEPGINGRWNFVSRGALGLTGYDPSNWLGNHHFWIDIIHEDDRQRILKEDAVLERYGVPGTQADATYRICTPDRDEISVHEHAVMVRLEDGKLVWRGVIVPTDHQIVRRGSGQPRNSD